MKSFIETMMFIGMATVVSACVTLSIVEDSQKRKPVTNFVHCRDCQNQLSKLVSDKEHDAWTLTVGLAEDGNLHVSKCVAVPKCFFPKVIWDGSGDRPFDMPERNGDREFDGGPDFGNGSWAQREDGHWFRFGG